MEMQRIKRCIEISKITKLNILKQEARALIRTDLNVNEIQKLEASALKENW